MGMTFRTLWLMMLCTLNAWPTSCNEDHVAPACEIEHHFAAVFLGVPIEKAQTGSVYLVRVENLVRGPKNTGAEVFVNAGWERAFELGRQYLFYGYAPEHVDLVTISNSPFGAPIPAAWISKARFPVFSAGICNPTRPSEMAIDDIAWLKNTTRGVGPSRIYGQVLQNYVFSRRPPSDEVFPLPAATVTLYGKGQSRTTVADSNGSYAFGGLPPGAYRLTANLPPWESSPTVDVELRAGACARRYLSQQSAARLTGRVFDHTGKPARHVDVQLVRLLPGSRHAHDPSASSLTAFDGTFSWDNLPAGSFVAGVNLTGPPSSTQPYDATYLPGVSSLSQAAKIYLRPNQSLEGLTLTLPPPVSFRSVTVDIVWADGAPAIGGARVRVEQGERQVEIVKAVHRNLVQLRLPQGVAYNLTAEWLNLNSQPWDYVSSQPVEIAAGASPVRLTVRLSKPKP